MNSDGDMLVACFGSAAASAVSLTSLIIYAFYASDGEVVIIAHDFCLYFYASGNLFVKESQLHIAMISS
jgi:hypothetical protein